MRSSICPSLYTKPFQSVHGLRRLLMLENFLLITRQLSGDVSIPPRDGFVAEPGGSLGVVVPEAQGSQELKSISACVSFTHSYCGHRPCRSP